MGSDAENGDRRQTKVERVLEKYDLEGYGVELEQYWTGDGSEQYSLRELATLLNREILGVAIRNAGIGALDGEIENYYRLLTDSEVSAGERTEARSRLERADIDVEALESDFVSHQAIHTYLTERRGAVHQAAPPEERLENSLTTLRRLESRVETVADNVLDSARSADLLEVGDYEVLVSTAVLCRSCGRQYPATELLKRGHCDCHVDEAT